MHFRLFLLSFILVTICGAGCATATPATIVQTTTSTLATQSPTSSTPPSSFVTSTHSLRDWLVNYETYGKNYQKTIDFTTHQEVLTATVGVPQSDGIWGIALYAEKNWQDGLPHRFYLQISESDLGGLGGSYHYKHYGPYTDTITSLIAQASLLHKGDMLSEHIELLSDIYTATSSAR